MPVIHTYTRTRTHARRHAQRTWCARTHTRTHAHTRTHTRARTHAHTHAHAHTHTHTTQECSAVSASTNDTRRHLFWNSQIARNASRWVMHWGGGGGGGGAFVGWGKVRHPQVLWCLVYSCGDHSPWDTQRMHNTIVWDAHGAHKIISVGGTTTLLWDTHRHRD